MNAPVPETRFSSRRWWIIAVGCGCLVMLAAAVALIVAFRVVLPRLSKPPSAGQPAPTKDFPFPGTVQLIYVPDTVHGAHNIASHAVTIT